MHAMADKVRCYKGRPVLGGSRASSLLRKARHPRRALPLALPADFQRNIRTRRTPRSGGRVESEFQGLSGMDAARAAMGQGWPTAACPWNCDGAREPRRSRGRMTGQDLCPLWVACQSGSPEGAKLEASAHAEAAQKFRDQRSKPAPPAQQEAPALPADRGHGPLLHEPQPTCRSVPCTRWRTQSAVPCRAVREQTRSCSRAELAGDRGLRRPARHGCRRGVWPVQCAIARSIPDKHA